MKYQVTLYYPRAFTRAFESGTEDEAIKKALVSFDRFVLKQRKKLALSCEVKVIHNEMLH